MKTNLLQEQDYEMKIDEIAVQNMSNDARDMHVQEALYSRWEGAIRKVKLHFFFKVKKKFNFEAIIKNREHSSNILRTL